MSSVNDVQYRAVSDAEEIAHKERDAIEESEYDSENEFMGTTYKRPSSRRLTSRTVSRVLAVANLVLFFILSGVTVAVLKYSNYNSFEGPEPPYSKVRVDGAVKLVNKKFKPQLIFQSEPSDEVDAAWNRTMEFDNTIGVKKETARIHNLPRSIEPSQDPSVMIYGISVFHQLHCLDMIRKSMYPERYFPDTDHEELVYHYNHCFDFLRQVIMCKADVSMIYWWNTNYTTVNSDGTRRDSDYYLNLSAEQRVKQSFVKWDVEHQCHDLDTVIEWLDENRVDRYW